MTVKREENIYDKELPYGKMETKSHRKMNNYVKNLICTKY